MAIGEVVEGMTVGLGSGTTVAQAIVLLGQRVSAGLGFVGIATSRATADLAQRANIPLQDFSSHATVHLAIDGVDEVDAALRAIKGAGGALLREKVVGAAAERMIAIADSSKQVDRLGMRPLPVEVLPFAAGFVASALADLGFATTLRAAGGEYFVTDQGNWIIDCVGGEIDEPVALAAAIAAIPGALAHGLFLTEIDALYIAGPGLAVTRRDRTALVASNSRRVDP